VKTFTGIFPPVSGIGNSHELISSVRECDCKEKSRKINADLFQIVIS
jgi:hypothetical protein